jgi:hypothetical protein
MPVAVYAARRRPIELSLLFGVSAAVEGFYVWRFGWAELGGALIVSALIGVPIGWALRRRWTYSRVVAMATALMSAVQCLFLWVQWDITEAALAKFVDEIQSPKAEYPDWVVNNLPGFLENARNLVFGYAVASMLVTVCLVTSVAARWLTVRDRYQLRGGFRELRQPDWLAWVVIAAFVAGFVDYHWPHDVLRWVSWNTGVALFGIYTTTGVAVMAYAAWIFHLPLWLMIAAILFLMLPFTMGLPVTVGLMDTWGEYRTKLDRWAAARKNGDSNHPPE